MRPVIDVLASVIGPHLSPDFESGPPPEVIANEAIQKLMAEGYIIMPKDELVVFNPGYPPRPREDSSLAEKTPAPKVIEAKSNA